jgi:hypothetical protein
MSKIRNNNYVIIHKNDDLEKIKLFLLKLKNPEVIISIITGVTNFKNWKNRRRF